MISSEMRASDYVFDLDAGWPCLDFANTLEASGTDNLNSYADLVAFAEQSKLLAAEDAAWLRAESRRDAATADQVMERASQLRRVIEDIFSALAAGGAAPELDLDELNQELAAGLSHARVVASKRTYYWGFEGRNMDAPLWPISRSAADLLTSETDLGKVRQCGGSDCNWLFLDTSKNRTRQWCSMQSCGNREKARRHYERQRRARVDQA